MRLTKKDIPELITKFAEAVRADEMKGAQSPEEHAEIINNYRETRSDLAVWFHHTLDRVEKLEAERDELLALFEFLDQEARRSRTGISFDWVPTCEGEPSGYRFMRHHHVGQPTKTLRKAIEEWKKRKV